jgi:hypothetical protein
LALLLGACGGPYTLRGRVVQGPFSTLDFVAADDARLDEPGLPNVEIEVYRDPDRGNQRVIARQLSRGDGGFEIALDEFGAGWMDELWRITAAARGRQTADLTLALPRGDDRRLLILLAPGLGPEPNPDLIEQFRRFDRP